MGLDHPTFSANRRAQFLDYLKVGGNASEAARAVGLSYSTVAKHRASDEDFARQWEDAVREAGGSLEAVVLGRARNGVSRPKVLSDGTFVRYPADHPQAGEIVYETQFDTAREALMLKRFLPEEYRERKDLQVRGEHQISQRMTDQEKVDRLNRLLDDSRLRAAGEQPDGVRTVEFRDLPPPSPEDLI